MIRLLVGILVFVINTVYRDRPIPRFYVLETVARVPYFSYLSVLHFYETCRDYSPMVNGQSQSSCSSHLDPT
jgi:hypothetical protein